MRKATIVVLTMLSVVWLGSAGFAQEKKKCPKGKVFNSETGKCVTPPRPPRTTTPRGSW
jgi:hypothetical protein